MNFVPQIIADQKLDDDSLWYKGAVIYQLHVKSFADSNNDGVGDFAGLTQKRDYLQDLGVTTLWLMPFYPSPGRDDGYDISDYGMNNPELGTMKDFRRFIQEAKRRGLRVITELVINHTSDQHPWFQRARRAGPHTDARNWYVWSDSDQRYAGTRIIFNDTEKSNWSWDPVANAYYWHRFFSHQPDLNYDNPRVLPRRHSVSVRARGYQQREPSADPRDHQEDPRGARRLCAQQAAAGRGQPVAGGRERLFRRRRRVPHGLSLPADAAHLHGDRARRPLSGHRHPAADARHPGELPMGAVPAQPRRAHARNGDGRRARLSLAPLCDRPAGAPQSRHPPAPRAAHGQRPAQDRADDLAFVLARRNPDHLLRRRDRDGRQHLCGRLP